MTTILKLYPCSIQPTVFSQAQRCDRNHTLGIEKNLQNILRDWANLNKISLGAMTSEFSCHNLPGQENLSENFH